MTDFEQFCRICLHLSHVSAAEDGIVAKLPIQQNETKVTKSCFTASAFAG